MTSQRYIVVGTDRIVDVGDMMARVAAAEEAIARLSAKVESILDWVDGETSGIVGDLYDDGG